VNAGRCAGLKSVKNRKTADFGAEFWTCLKKKEKLRISSGGGRYHKAVTTTEGGREGIGSGPSHLTKGKGNRSSLREFLGRKKRTTAPAGLGLLLAALSCRKTPGVGGGCLTQYRNSGPKKEGERTKKILKTMAISPQETAALKEWGAKMGVWCQGILPTLLATRRPRAYHQCPASDINKIKKEEL